MCIFSWQVWGSRCMARFQAAAGGGVAWGIVHFGVVQFRVAGVGPSPS